MKNHLAQSRSLQPFEWEAGGRRFVIRSAETETDYHEVEEIQREAWEFSDLDVVSAGHLIASLAAGGMLLCAFEGDRMVGFVYGFPGFEDGCPSIHSHMLAVRADVRNLAVGFKLKLAQRLFALERGIREVTWTFDPLQSLNAHLNFAKLGVISHRYLVDFYGQGSSSPLHQGFGTDRLWVSWLLDGEHVETRLAASDPARPARAENPDEVPDSSFLVIADRDKPRTKKATPAEDRLYIEIPADINSLKQRDSADAVAWRQATRAAFLAALERGYFVGDFRLVSAAGRSLRAYELMPKQSTQRAVSD